MSIVEVNSKSIDEFIHDYLPPPVTWQVWTHPQNASTYHLTLQHLSTLSAIDFESCYELIKSTSFHHYHRSSYGWNDYDKREEMKLPDLKYLLVKKEDKLEGFMSFMPTFDNRIPIVYCYEIHLSPSLQGSGLGSWLMIFLEAIARRIPTTQKIMLTCFVLNTRAVNFYNKLGFVVDTESPLPKQLRDGTIIEPGYRILSKEIFAT